MQVKALELIKKEELLEKMIKDKQEIIKSLNRFEEDSSEGGSSPGKRWQQVEEEPEEGEEG